MELGHSKAAVSGASGVSSTSGTSGASGKAGKHAHLLNAMDMVNDHLQNLNAKIEEIRAELPEYEVGNHFKKGKNDVSGSVSGTSAVSSAGHRKFGHN
jgi:hypothetical protein